MGAENTLIRECGNIETDQDKSGQQNVRERGLKLVMGEDAVYPSIV